MSNFTGTSDNDNLVGTIGNDVFDLSQGGEDTVIGLDGDDIIQMGAALDANDHIDGWTGNDTVALDGDYSAGLVLAASTLVNIEKITFAAGHSYNITTSDATVGSALTFDATLLGAADLLIVDGSAETSGSIIVRGGAGSLTVTGGAGADSFTGGSGDDVLSGGGGKDTINGSDGNDILNGNDQDDTLTGGGGNNTLNGGNGDDTLNLSAGASDIANGGDGNDFINFGHAWDESDQVDGGSGADTLALSGDYGTDLVHIRGSSVETIDAQGLTQGNFAVDMGDETLRIRVNAGRGDHNLSFTWGADTLADEQTTYYYYAADGNYTLEGANQNDFFHFPSHPGVEVAKGNGGDDVFFFYNNFSAIDSVDGGSGNDTLTLDGAEQGLIVFAADTVVNVETIKIITITGVSITTDDATVAAGSTLHVDARFMHGALAFDGSAETNGRFVVLGGNSSDTLFGGAGNDSLSGGGGDNVFEGGGGSDAVVLAGNTDLLIYRSAADSTSTAYDIVSGFDTAKDLLDPFVRVTAIDAAITSGTLSHGAAFDPRLAAAVNATTLEANHAVLFEPTKGNDHGLVFLVVDQNGVAGYQPGQDLVVQLKDTADLANFSLSNFI